MGKELMDCEQVRELLDAYALGAAEGDEAAGLEGHVADCIRCWEELTKSQQTAAMLALAIPIQSPPEYLEGRVMKQAEVQRRPAAPAGAGGGFFSRLRVGWPATAGALAVASVAALAFAALLQVQLTDLRDDKEGLEAQVQADSQVLSDMQEIMTVAFSDDLSTTELAAVSTAGISGSALYGWSRKHLSGFIICQDLPPLEEDQVFQAWFHAGENVVNAGTFRSEDGTCHLPVELSSSMPLSGFGISIEPEGGSARPSSGWLMYADFGR